MNLSLNIKSIVSNTRGWFILCLSSIALGLSISKPLMALGLFGLLIVWLADGRPKEKIKAFWTNKTAVIISSIYLITVLGLIHTSNWEFALDDLRRKLPIFFIPFYVAGFSPITKKELHLLLKVFLTGVLIATFWSLFVYFGGLDVSLVDKRDLSRFNSHIRFGLEIALAIFISVYFFFKSIDPKQKLIWCGISFWLISSLVLFSLFTGLLIFVSSSIFLLVFFGIMSSKKKIKWIFATLFTTTTVASILFLVFSVIHFNESIIPKTIEEKEVTTLGKPYQIVKGSTEKALQENGYLLDKHISWGEFAHAWRQRSKIEFEEKDLKGNLVKNTLIRFVSSKGLRKDKEGISQLSDKEIIAIENGIPNYLYLEMNPISIRIHKILWEYNNAQIDGDINGHSVLMRFEYLKTAISIIKKNKLFGVGTGDIQDEFNNQYEQSNSKLAKKYRLRTHNQFLAFGVSFGVIGFCWFICCLFYPLLINANYKNYLYISFLSILLLSMLSEDTLEVQAGINFFAFFNVILRPKLNSL